MTASAVDYADEARLAELLWNHSPHVLQARQQATQAASEEMRARLYPNPQLDLAWDTIPIGRTTPANLQDPIGNVPNYSAGLSELIELGKRGPRQAATAAEREMATEESIAVFADQWFELLQTVGHIAVSAERASVLDHEVSEGERVLELERARADKGEIARMHVVRSEAEQTRLSEARDAARTELEASRAECAALLSVPCPGFDSEQSALSFLDRGAHFPVPGEWSADIETRRPDLAALSAAARAADERITLAKRKVIPDPTLRLGYTYDTFVASGSQRQSLGVGMQLPLPVFDYGQADVSAASATLLRARSTREALIASGRIALESALRRKALLADRLAHLRSAIEKAVELRNAMQGAAREGGVSQLDVLLARRRVQEALLDRTQVDLDLFSSTLDARRAAALFPQPADFGEVSQP